MHLPQMGGGSQRSASPLESRFTDGLTEAPSSVPLNSFYDVDYVPEKETLKFCMDLPQNNQGLYFPSTSIMPMCQDAVLKTYELRRQKVTMNPKYVMPIYVYTYELQGDDPHDQIYAAMNRAMRDNDQSGINFWRPLICQVCTCGILVQ